MAAVIALVLLLLARRGRVVDDHPYCRRCGFDLFNRPADSLRCPECGADVGGPRAVRIGRRRRNPALLWLTTAAFAGALLLVGAVGMQRLRTVDWVRYYPLRMVVRQAATGGSADQQRAFDELSRRLRRPGGGPEVVAEALRIQGDRALPWDDRWGDLVVEAQREKLTAPGQWEQFLRQSTRWELRTRERVALEDDFFFQIQQHADRLWGYQPELFLDHSEGLTISAGALHKSWPRIGSGSAGRSGTTSSFGGAYANGWPKQLGPGIAEVTLHVDHPLTAMGVTAACSDEAHFHITILPAGEPSVRLVHRPELEAAMLAAIQLKARKNNDGTLEMALGINHPPMSGAFDLLSGDFVMSSVTFTPATEMMSMLTMRPNADQYKARSATFVLRPSVKRAGDSLDIYEIYGDELRLETSKTVYTHF
jgi:hypothetical protein